MVSAEVFRLSSETSRLCPSSSRSVHLTQYVEHRLMLCCISSVKRDKFELVDAYHFWLSECVDLKKGTLHPCKAKLIKSMPLDAIGSLISLGQKAGEL